MKSPKAFKLPSNGVVFQTEPGPLPVKRVWPFTQAEKREIIKKGAKVAEKLKQSEAANPTS